MARSVSFAPCSVRTATARATPAGASESNVAHAFGVDRVFNARSAEMTISALRGIDGRDGRGRRQLRRAEPLLVVVLVLVVVLLVGPGWRELARAW